MYGCESWTIKKAEHQRIDTFELWCWRRLLRVPWTARRSNQSILKEISPECSLEGLMLKLKLRYFGCLMWRTDSLEKALMLGKIEDRRRRGQTEDEMVGWHHRCEGHEFELAPGVGDGQGSLACCSPWDQKESDMSERLNWTEWCNYISENITLSSNPANVVTMCLLILFYQFKVDTISVHLISFTLYFQINFPNFITKWNGLSSIRPLTRLQETLTKHKKYH